MASINVLSPVVPHDGNLDLPHVSDPFDPIGSEQGLETTMDSTKDLGTWLHDAVHLPKCEERAITTAQEMNSNTQKIKEIDARIHRLNELKKKILSFSVQHGLPPNCVSTDCSSSDAYKQSQPKHVNVDAAVRPPPPPLAHIVTVYSKPVTPPPTPPSSTKRSRRSSMSSSCSSGSASVSGSDLEDNTMEDMDLNEDQQKLQRRAQNRASAKKSRARKKQKTQQLQKVLNELKNENKKLMKFVESKLGASKVRTLLEQQRALRRQRVAKEATRNLIRALKNPANRMLNSRTLAFLDKLRENVEKNYSWHTKVPEVDAKDAMFIKS
jgi:hypothetical protein